MFTLYSHCRWLPINHIPASRQPFVLPRMREVVDRKPPIAPPNPIVIPKFLGIWKGYVAQLPFKIANVTIEKPTIAATIFTPLPSLSFNSGNKRSEPAK